MEEEKFDRMNEFFVKVISNANVLCEYIKNEGEKYNVQIPRCIICKEFILIKTKLSILFYLYHLKLPYICAS